MLEKLSGFTVHAVQGRKQSDYHKHENREQLFYILGGEGQILCGDTMSPVEVGDIIYRPSGQYHQLFNPADGWLQHHVINMPVDGDGGQFVKRNWRDKPPLSDGEGAVRWQLHGPEKEQAGDWPLYDLDHGRRVIGYDPKQVRQRREVSCSLLSCLISLIPLKCFNQSLWVIISISDTYIWNAHVSAYRVSGNPEPDSGTNTVAVHAHRA